MAGKPAKRCGTRPRAAGLVLVPLLLAGCSTGPGGGMRFTLFPDRGTLMESTKAVRQPADPPPAVPRELDQRVLPPYTVEPGDSILIQPADVDSPVQAQLPGDQIIMPDGTVSLGRYGEVIVAGKTVREMENLIRAVIQGQGKDPGPIVVRVVARVSKVYYVLGEVNSPGAFPLRGNELVLDGIVAAGGLTDRASRKNIILARPTPPNSCRIVLPVCYNAIVQLGDSTTNYQLAPGDRIFVPGRSGNIFHRSKEESPCCGPQSPCPLAPDGHAPHFAPAAPGAHLGSPPASGALPPLNRVILPSPTRDAGGLPLREGP
jgi:polysaccharide biosynthesis/export protein